MQKLEKTQKKPYAKTRFYILNIIHKQIIFLFFSIWYVIVNFVGTRHDTLVIVNQSNVWLKF
jgi:hypothetical protein